MHTVERIEEFDLTSAIDSKIGGLIADTFKTDFEGRSFYQNRHHRRYLVWEDRALIGHLAISFRSVRLGQELLDIIGIGEVAVAFGHRRQGIGNGLVNTALDDGRRSMADFALLFGAQSIYEDAGFRNVNNVVTITQIIGAKTQNIERASSPFLMVAPLGEAKWREDVPLDLAGFSF